MVQSPTQIGADALAALPMPKKTLYYTVDSGEPFVHLTGRCSRRVIPGNVRREAPAAVVALCRCTTERNAVARVWGAVVTAAAHVWLVDDFLADMERQVGLWPHRPLKKFTESTGAALLRLHTSAFSEISGQGTFRFILDRVDASLTTTNRDSAAHDGSARAAADHVAAEVARVRRRTRDLLARWPVERYATKFGDRTPGDELVVLTAFDLQRATTNLLSYDERIVGLILATARPLAVAHHATRPGLTLTALTVPAALATVVDSSVGWHAPAPADLSPAALELALHALAALDTCGNPDELLAQITAARAALA